MTAATDTATDTAAPDRRWAGARFRIVAARFFSTHHDSAAALLAGRARAPVAPAFALLEGRARRFTSLATQLHMEVCGPLHALAAAPPLGVFATRHGEIQAADKLISDFRDAAVTSSARFALSVHNTPSGLYSVATSSTAPTVTITGANALAAGWLEAALTAAAEDQPVLLSMADEPVPPALQGPTDPVGFGAGFLLATGPGPGRLARLAITSSSSSSSSSSSGAADASAPAAALARVIDALDGAQDGAAAVTCALGALAPGHFLELQLLPPEEEPS